MTHIDLIGVSGCGKTTLKIMLIDLYKTEGIRIAGNTNMGMINADSARRPGIKSRFQYLFEKFFLGYIFKRLFRRKRIEKINDLLKEKFFLSNLDNVEGFITEGIFHQISEPLPNYSWAIRQFVSMVYRHGRTIVVYLTVADATVACRQMVRAGFESGSSAVQAHTMEKVRYRRILLERFIYFLEQNWFAGKVVRVYIAQGEPPAAVVGRVKSILDEILSESC